METWSCRPGRAPARPNSASRSHPSSQLFKLFLSQKKKSCIYIYNSVVGLILGEVRQSRDCRRRSESAHWAEIVYPLDCQVFKRSANRGASCAIPAGVPRPASTAGWPGESSDSPLLLRGNRSVSPTDGHQFRCPRRPFA